MEILFLGTLLPQNLWLWFLSALPGWCHGRGSTISTYSSPYPNGDSR